MFFLFQKRWIKHDIDIGRIGNVTTGYEKILVKPGDKVDRTRICARIIGKGFNITAEGVKSSIASQSDISYWQPRRFRNDCKRFLCVSDPILNGLFPSQNESANIIGALLDNGFPENNLSG